MSRPDSIGTALPESAPPRQAGRRITEIAPGQDMSGEVTLGSLSIDSGGGMTLWSPAGTTSKTDSLIKLQLQPGQQVVIGRQEGGELEYLDPRFTPTQIVPQTGRPILAHHGAEQDMFVSRGHFMLCGARGGIVLTNGVPRRGGGIRPPRNWTKLLYPEQRLLTPAEELWIGPGDMARISLPNDTVISIQAQ